MFDSVFVFIGWVLTLGFALIAGLTVGLVFHEWTPSLITGGIAGCIGWFLFLRKV